MPSPTFTAKGLPLRQEGVELYYQTAQTVLTKTSIQSKEDDKMQLLEKLEQTFKTEETNFYKEVGLTQASAQANLLELNARIEKANQAVNFLIAPESIQNLLDDKDIQTAFKEAVTEGFIEAMQTKEFRAFLKSLWNKDSPNAIAEFWEKLRNELGKYLDTSKDRYFIKHGGERGLGKFVATYDKDTGEVTISIKEKNYVSSSFRNKFMGAAKKAVDAYIKEHPEGVKGLKKNSKAQKANDTNKTLAFKTMLIEKITTLINNHTFLDTNIKKCLKYQLEQNASKYDVRRNPSSVKGFIGELWANALISYIYSGGNTDDAKKMTVPTGNVRAKDIGEIGIDMVLESYGFQVKKYTLTNNKIMEIKENNKQLGYFLKHRLQLPLASTLALYFGVLQFNQPYTDDDKYQSLYSNMTNLVNPNSGVDSPFENLLTLYLDRNIRIAQELGGIGGEKDPFYKVKEYKNTFFIINNWIIPSSELVKCIREEYWRKKQQSATQGMISFKINGITLNTSGKYGTTLGSVLFKSSPEEIAAAKAKREKQGAKSDKKAKDKHKIYSDFQKTPYDLSNEVRISYEIEINVKDIFDRAIGKAQKEGGVQA